MRFFFIALVLFAVGVSAGATMNYQAHAQATNGCSHRSDC
jgi:hypothetical protein